MSNQPFTINSQDTQFMIEEYTSWYVQILERVFYPRDMSENIVAQPSSFISWIEDMERDGLESRSILPALKQLHIDFVTQGQICLAAMAGGNLNPDYKDFKKLNVVFEELLKHIGSMSFVDSRDERYMDEQTGLGAKRALERDLEVEIERLARHGKSFTLALIRVNQFEELESDLPPGEFSACLRLLAGVVEKSIRSFDDAYYLGDGRFAVCLKQSDNSEGIRALARLKAELQEKSMVYRVKNGLVVLSVSSCITEPMPGDELDVVLQDLEEDLKAYNGEGSGVLEHREISPLQRYLKDSAAS